MAFLPLLHEVVFPEAPGGYRVALSWHNGWFCSLQVPMHNAALARRIQTEHGVQCDAAGAHWSMLIPITVGLDEDLLAAARQLLGKYDIALNEHGEHVFKFNCDEVQSTKGLLIVAMTPRYAKVYGNDEEAFARAARRQLNGFEDIRTSPVDREATIVFTPGTVTVLTPIAHGIARIYYN